MNSFRIVTYNIHKARGVDGFVRIERVARVLKAINSDIIALQEVVNRDGPSIEDHQTAYLADQFGFHYAVGETRKHEGGVYGNVTLSRWKPETIRQIDLSVAGREERGVLRTDIRIGDQLIHIFNLHLGTGYCERRTQASKLMDRDLLKAVDITGPRVVLGDFNEWTHGLATRTLLGEFHLTDLRDHLPRRRSYPALFPVLHLDHIYYDHQLRVRYAAFNRTRLSLVASDHVPLVADFEVVQKG